MANSYFQFKHFIVHQDKCAMKVTTDGCLFGAWVADMIRSRPFCNLKAPERALDIGTGTGLLSLLLVQRNPHLNIDAIEIDKDAADQALQNINASPWADRIQVIHADAKEYPFTKKYHTIICNPPFYENELKGENTKKNIAHHNEGLLLPELFEVIKNNLDPGGSFFLLLPYKRNEEIKKLLAGNEMGVEKIVFVRQTPRHDHFRMVIQGKLNGTLQETAIEEMIIKDDEEKYTPTFQALLREYYLHL
jgi:tRNA1Val (adenine37-N6)-methyltransferase